MNQKYEEAVINLAKAWHTLKQEGAIGLMNVDGIPQVQLRDMKLLKAIKGDIRITPHNEKYIRHEILAYGVCFIYLEEGKTNA